MPAQTPQALANRAAYNRQYQKDHSEDLKEYRKKWQRDKLSTPKGRVEQLLRAAKKRAKQSGREFSICADDLEIPTHCPLLGIELDYGLKEKTAKPNSPSIDRIDSSKGYVQGNVWIVSWRANLLKNNGELWELEAIVRSLKEKLCQTQTASQPQRN